MVARGDAGWGMGAKSVHSCGFQYGVHGDAQLHRDSLPRQSVMSELREMLKLQQAQLNQLTQNIVCLQAIHSHSHTLPVRKGPVICRQCHKPGHFARKCEEEHVLPHPPMHSQGNPGVSEGGQPRSTQPSEN